MLPICKLSFDFALSPYRIMEPAGRKITEKPPPINHCGTYDPGWLNGSHPETLGQTVSRTVCYVWRDVTCFDHNTISITNCGDFFVYLLYGFYSSTRYCAE